MSDTAGTTEQRSNDRIPPAPGIWSEGADASEQVMLRRRVVSGLALFGFLGAPWDALFGSVSLFDVTDNGCSVEVGYWAPLELAVAVMIFCAAGVAGFFRATYRAALPLAAAAASTATVGVAISSTKWLDQHARGVFTSLTCPPVPNAKDSYYAAMSIFYDLGAYVLALSTFLAIALVAVSYPWNEQLRWPTAGRLGFRSTARRATCSLLMIAAILLVLLASVMLLATGDNFPSAPLGKFFSTLLIVSLLTLLPEGPALRLGQAAAWATVANAFAQFGTVKQLVVEHKYGKQKFDGDRLDLSSNIPDAQLESLRNVASVYLLVTAAALLLLLFGWLSRRFLYRPLVSASSHEKFASPAVAESTGDQSPGLGPANLDTGGT